MTFLRERLLGGGDSPPELEEDHQARQAAMLFAVALIVVALGGLVFLLLRSDDSAPEQPRAQSTTEIGPLPGTDLASYLAARERALDDTTGSRIAVVSLAQYTTEPDARAAVGPLTVTALLAAPPGGTPSPVTGSMAEWAEAQVATSREERDELRKMLPTVDDPAFRDFYRAEIDQLTRVVDGVRPEGPLVFAVVVRGAAPALQQLAQRAGVRLVDVGASADAAPGAVYRGVRPEETSKADEPPTRPL